MAFLNIDQHLICNPCYSYSQCFSPSIDVEFKKIIFYTAFIPIFANPFSNIMYIMCMKSFVYITLHYKYIWNVIKSWNVIFHIYIYSTIYNSKCPHWNYRNTILHRNTTCHHMITYPNAKWLTTTFSNRQRSTKTIPSHSMPTEWASRITPGWHIFLRL